MKLEVLIGPICSGKSTYAKRRAKEGAIIVCHDDLTEMIHGEYRYEKELRSEYRACEESIARTFLESGKDVIIDRTHLTRESRSRWIDFAKHEYQMFHPADHPEVIAVVFPIDLPPVSAMRRFEHDARGRPYEEWLRVARHHFAQLQDEPFDWSAEGFDKFHYSTYDGILN